MTNDFLIVIHQLKAYKWICGSCVSGYRSALFINNELGKIPLDETVLKKIIT